MRREQSEQQDTNHSSVIDDNENKNNEVNNCKLNYNKVYRNEVDNDEVESTDMSDTVDSSSNNYNEVDNNEVGVIVKINSTSDTNDTSPIDGGGVRVGSTDTISDVSRDMLLQELLEIARSTLNNKTERRSKTCRFWHRMRKIYGNKANYRKVYRWVHDRVERYAEKFGPNSRVSSMGYILDAKTGETTIRRRFNLKNIVAPYFSEAEEKECNGFRDTIPFAVVGMCNNESLLVSLESTHTLLREYFSKEIGSHTKHHSGVSLGYTVAKGGRHSDAKIGVSGSIHANQNLLNNYVQISVITVCCDIIKAVFGRTKWYNELIAL